MRRSALEPALYCSDSTSPFVGGGELYRSFVSHLDIQRAELRINESRNQSKLGVSTMITTMRSLDNAEMVASPAAARTRTSMYSSRSATFARSTCAPDRISSAHAPIALNQFHERPNRGINVARGLHVIGACALVFDSGQGNKRGKVTDGGIAGLLSALATCLRQVKVSIPNFASDEAAFVFGLPPDTSQISQFSQFIRIGLVAF